MSSLLVEFDPLDRRKIGSIKLLDMNEGLILLLSALGIADRGTAAKKNNPNADPLKDSGDTPTGEYQVLGIISTGPESPVPKLRNVNMFGSNGYINLKGTAGDAFSARNNENKPRGIAIHGGLEKGQHLLRPTNGCIRMSNSEIKELIEKMFELNLAGDPVDKLKVIETPLSTNILVEDTDDVDEGDPPF